MNPCASSSLFSQPPLPADTFYFEHQLRQQGHAWVAGLDEAGRGPLAGPVVAACVILPEEAEYQLFRDSKQLSPSRREALFALLHQNGAVVGVGLTDPREIEQINILRASLLAMERALAACTAANNDRSPSYLLVDGTFPVPVALPQLPLVKGESKSASIAAASIIAKVTRDRIMTKAHALYPQYGFDRHQGYPTKAHRQALSRFGPCPLHRRTFRGVAEFVDSLEPEPRAVQPSLW